MKYKSGKGVEPRSKHPEKKMAKVFVLYYLFIGELLKASE